MAGPSYVESLPPAQAGIVNGILERLPQAQRPEALRVCRTIIERCGENAPEALRRFAAIASSGHFTPSMMGTVSLIATRAGPNVVSTLTAFERLLSSEKFNRHVHEAARLSVIRAGTDSSEALNALYNLVDNPSFSTASLNIALPDRFLRFLDSAIRAGGDEAYMSIRAMASLFCNPNFGPADLTARFAASFGRQIAIIRADGGANSLEALESFSTLLANSSINPREITESAAHAFTSLTIFVLERTQIEYSPDTPDSTENSMRTFRLIIGSRGLSLPMLSDGGLLSAFLHSRLMPMPSSLDMFHDFMRAARRTPRALEMATHWATSFTGAVLHPAVLHLLTSIASNPSLSPLFDDPESEGRLFSIITSFERGHLTGVWNGSSFPLVAREMPAALVLSELVRDPRVTLHGFEQIVSMMESLGEFADVGVSILQQYMYDSPQRGFPSDAELAGIPACIRQIESMVPPQHRAGPAGPHPAPFQEGGAASSPEEEAGRSFTNPITSSWSGLSLSLGVLVATPGFNIQMLGSDGLIPALLERCNWDDVRPALSRLSLILGNESYHASMESFLRDIIHHSRRSERPISYHSAFRYLNIFYDLLQAPNFDRRCLPVLSEAVRRNPGRVSPAMEIYASLSRNPSFRSLLQTPAFAERAVRLAAGAGSGEGRQSFLRSFNALATLPGFTPALFERVERLTGIAGPDSGSVMLAIVISSLSRSDGPGQPLSKMLSDEFISFLTAMVRIAPAASRGEVASALGTAFNNLSGQRTGQELELQMRLLATFREFILGAGDQAVLLADVFPKVMASVFSRQSITPAQVQLLSPEASRRYGAWARTYLRSVPRGSRAEAVEGVAIMFGSIANNDPLYSLMFDRPESFEAGRRLAERVIGGFAPPEVCLNFAYAIETIGAERATVLYQRFGIRHFARYSTEVLNRLYERASGRSTRPAALVVLPEYDYNGAFYVAGRRLDALLRDFDVIIYERDSEQGFFSAASDFSRSFGRTNTLIIGGHGSPDSVRLGAATDEGMLDLTDADQITALRGTLSPNSSIILISCSTGRDENSIGALFSRLLGATLYAPTTPSNVANFRISGGRVSATFEHRTGVFSSGRQTGGASQ
jgi:hypothetical protein